MVASTNDALTLLGRLSAPDTAQAVVAYREGVERLRVAFSEADKALGQLPVGARRKIFDGTAQHCPPEGHQVCITGRPGPTHALRSIRLVWINGHLQVDASVRTDATVHSMVLDGPALFDVMLHYPELATCFRDALVFVHRQAELQVQSLRALTNTLVPR